MKTSVVIDRSPLLHPRTTFPGLSSRLVSPSSPLSLSNVTLIVEFIILFLWPFLLPCRRFIFSCPRPSSSPAPLSSPSSSPPSPPFSSSLFSSFPCVSHVVSPSVLSPAGQPESSPPRSGLSNMKVCFLARRRRPHPRLCFKTASVCLAASGCLRPSHTQSTNIIS